LQLKTARYGAGGNKQSLNPSACVGIPHAGIRSNTCNELGSVDAISERGVTLSAVGNDLIVLGKQPPSPLVLFVFEEYELFRVDVRHCDLTPMRKMRISNATRMATKALQIRLWITGANLMDCDCVG
jgi:hypothetical protein